MVTDYSNKDYRAVTNHRFGEGLKIKEVYGILKKFIFILEKNNLELDKNGKF